MATKLGARRGRPPKLSIVTDAPPRDAKPGDNKKAIEEAEAAQLLSYLATAREKKGALDKAKAVAKAAADELNETFRLAKAASPNFTRARMVELMTDMSSPQLRKNIAADEATRARFRRICGLPVGDEGQQQDLMPETAKDQMHYRGLGYTAGLGGENGGIPDFVPSNFGPDWSQGWKDGQAILIAATIKTAETPKPPPTPKTDAKEAAKEVSVADERLAERRAIKAAADALKAAAETPLAKARATLAKLVDTDADAARIAQAQHEVERLEGEQAEQPAEMV